MFAVDPGLSRAGSTRVVETLMGDVTTFYADVRRDGHYTSKGMVCAKIFYGGWCCFPAGFHPSSIRVLRTRPKAGHDECVLYFGGFLFLRYDSSHANETIQELKCMIFCFCLAKKFLFTGAASGTFYLTYPIHRTLISINKRFTGKTNKEFNLRHDWNSLLSHDESLLMTKYSKVMFVIGAVG